MIAFKVTICSNGIAIVIISYEQFTHIIYVYSLIILAWVPN